MKTCLSIFTIKTTFLINVLSVYNKLFDSFSKTVFEFIINYCRTVLESDERF